MYRFLYFIITFNLDYVKQLVHIKQYSSKFGGMWTDRQDFAKILNRKRCEAVIDDSMEKLVEHWRSEGFIILQGAIEPRLINKYLDELNALQNNEPSCLLVTGAFFEGPQIYRPELIKPEYSIRIVDDYFFSEACKEILLHKQITDFLEIIFEKKPILTQSLSFKYGSEQSVHRDTAFVRMNAPNKMAAVWVALEDVKPGAGELVYYPGSHLWEDYLFSGYFKHFDEERDGNDQLNAWYRWIHEEASKRECALRSFLPEQGDVLIWHAGLAHGGAPITAPDKTRLSLVGHYCPEGVRPLYHYYKPKQRKYYESNGYLYSTGYYS